MIAVSILLIVCSLLAWLSYRFIPAGSNGDSTLTLARLFVVSVLLGVLVLVCTLILWGLGRQQGRFNRLTPIRSQSEFQTAVEQENPTWLMVEGSISPDMATVSGSYVAVIEIDRSSSVDGVDDVDIFHNFPSGFQIRLADGNEVEADTNFKDRSYPQTWPSDERGLNDTVYYVEHSTPVVLIGKPTIQQVNTNDGLQTAYRLFDTEVMAVGDAADFSTNIGQSLTRWSFFGQSMAALGALTLLWIITKSWLVYLQIRQDSTFEWAEVKQFIQVR